LEPAGALGPPSPARGSAGLPAPPSPAPGATNAAYQGWDGVSVLAKSDPEGINYALKRDPATDIGLLAIGKLGTIDDKRPRKRGRNGVIEDSWPLNGAVCTDLDIDLKPKTLKQETDAKCPPKQVPSTDLEMDAPRKEAGVLEQVAATEPSQAATEPPQTASEPPAKRPAPEAATVPAKKLKKVPQAAVVDQKTKKKKAEEEKKKMEEEKKKMEEEKKKMEEEKRKMEEKKIDVEKKKVEEEKKKTEEEKKKKSQVKAAPKSAAKMAVAVTPKPKSKCKSASLPSPLVNGGSAPKKRRSKSQESTPSTKSKTDEKTKPAAGKAPAKTAAKGPAKTVTKPRRSSKNRPDPAAEEAEAAAVVAAAKLPESIPRSQCRKLIAHQKKLISRCQANKTKSAAKAKLREAAQASASSSPAPAADLAAASPAPGAASAEVAGPAVASGPTPANKSVVVDDPRLVTPAALKTPKWSNGWSWQGEPFTAKVYLNVSFIHSTLPRKACISYLPHDLIFVKIMGINDSQPRRENRINLTISSVKHYRPSVAMHRAAYFSVETDYQK